MSSILAPIGWGLLTFILVSMALGFIVASLLAPWPEVVLRMPVLVLLVALVMGGYIAGRKARTAYLSRKLVVGALVGLLSMHVYFATTGSPLVVWFFILTLGGGAVSAFGALLSERYRALPL